MFHGDRRVRSAAVLIAAFSEELAGMPGVAKHDEVLGPHFETYDVAILLGPFVELEEGLLRWYLVQIAQAKLGGRPGWEVCWASCLEQIACDEENEECDSSYR